MALLNVQPWSWADRTGLIFLVFLTIASSGNLYGLSSIDTSEAVEIGGIKQWISIKGINDHDPILLFLHGGPGNSAMSYGDRFTSLLQKHFVVVQWDQRESGKTAKLNTSLKALTVELMLSDAIEVINYLRKRFSCEKIYLMGHSWGGFLGLQVAHIHPELLEAYFAISPMVSQLKSECLSLEWMRGKGKEANNSRELRELANVVIPFENGEQLYYHRKWLALEMGTSPPSKVFVDTWARKWLMLFNEASMLDLFEAATEIRCPAYFFVGSRDHQTYFKLTESFYEEVKAEKKGLFWFINSAHNPHLTEQKKFQEIVISLLMSKN